jgi:hypothetical protein
MQALHNVLHCRRTAGRLMRSVHRRTALLLGIVVAQRNLSSQEPPHRASPTRKALRRPLLCPRFRGNSSCHLIMSLFVLEGKMSSCCWYILLVRYARRTATRCGCSASSFRNYSATHAPHLTYRHAPATGMRSLKPRSRTFSGCDHLTEPSSIDRTRCKEIMIVYVQLLIPAYVPIVVSIIICASSQHRVIRGYQE